MFEFGIKDIIDILIVAVLLYTLYKMMKESGTISIFTGVLAFVGVWIVVSHILNMRLIGLIMDKFMSVGLLILVILFQDEIKRFLVQLGNHKRWRFFLSFFLKHKKENIEKPYIMPVVHACMNMAKTKTGALIVIEQGVSLDGYKATGDNINADVNARLIENIFFKNSPLHDGALIISDDRIAAAACILPVSHNNNIPKSMGLRHRSALGITETTDAISIIVSEETGNISLAHSGKIMSKLSGKDLEHLLTEKAIE